jgi:hypothetical protein
MNSVMGEWAALLLRSFQAPGAPKSPWSVVFRDALLRRLTLRFVLCRAALTLHTSVGGNPANLPRVFPDLPKEVSHTRPPHATSAVCLELECYCAFACSCIVVWRKGVVRAQQHTANCRCA